MGVVRLIQVYSNMCKTNRHPPRLFDGFSGVENNFEWKIEIFLTSQNGSKSFLNFSQSCSGFLSAPSVEVTQWIMSLHLCNYVCIKGKAFSCFNKRYISKTSFDFNIELLFRDLVSISKSNFDLKIDFRFQDGASVLILNFVFKMELQFLNRAPLSQPSSGFEISLWFQYQVSILEPNFNFKIEYRSLSQSLILKSNLNLQFEVRFLNLSSIVK